MRMKMKMYLAVLFLLLLSGCKSGKVQQLESLMNELGITFTCESDSNVIVLIPTTGCASCIQGALNDVRESCDTAFVLLGCSKKELALLYKGKVVPSYPNVYLAKNIVSLSSDVMLTYPIAYILREGQYVDSQPYIPLKKPITSNKPETEVYIDKRIIELGDIDKDKIYRNSVRITNRGKVDLHIADVESSCDCTQVEYEKQVLPPSETLELHITFHPEEKGYFERYILIHCNVSDSPIEILMNGRVL